MLTLGDLLRKAREKAHYTLEDLAEETHIKIEYLEALEDSNFDALPAATFVKAYIRNYARVFEIDEKPLFAILRRDYEESVKGQLIRRDMLHPKLRRKTFYSPVHLVFLAAAAVFLVFFSYAAWQWYQLSKPPFLILESPSENESVSSRVFFQGSTRPDAVVTINSMPVALQSDGSFSVEFYLPQEGVNTVTLRASDQDGKSTVIQRSVHVEF